MSAKKMDEDEKKITEIKELKMVNTCTYKILKEDHTIGIIIQTQLLKDKQVIYAGYRVPHPLEHVLKIKIQTNHSSYPPKRALLTGINELINNLSQFKQDFEDELYKYKNNENVMNDV